MLGMLLGFAASGLWALANVNVQRSARTLGTLRGLVWTLILGTLLVAAASVLLDARSVPFTGTTLAWVAVAGVASLVAYPSLFYATHHGALSVVVPIASSWAVLSTAVGIGLFGETLGHAQLGGVALVAVGVVLLSRPAAPTAVAAPTDPVRARRAVAAAFGCALGFGVLIPALDRLTPAVGAFGAIGAAYAACIVGGIPLALRARVPLAPPPRGALPAVLLAAFFETAGFVCVGFGTTLAPIGLVAPMASLSSPITVLYAWLVLHERPTHAHTLGAALTSAGVLALAL